MRPSEIHALVVISIIISKLHARCFPGQVTRYYAFHHRTSMVRSPLLFDIFLVPVLPHILVPLALTLEPSTSIFAALVIVPTPFVLLAIPAWRRSRSATAFPSYQLYPSVLSPTLHSSFSTPSIRKKSVSHVLPFTADFRSGTPRYIKLWKNRNRAPHVHSENNIGRKFAGSVDNACLTCRVDCFAPHVSTTYKCPCGDPSFDPVNDI
jgi:hypothetical protein